MLNVEANVEVDSTGLDALVQLHDELQGRGIVLALARVKNDLMSPMRRYGVVDVIGEAEHVRHAADGGSGLPGVGGRASGARLPCRATRPPRERLSALDALGLRTVRAQPQPATGRPGS